MPERKLFIEAESQRKSDSCAVFARLVSFYCIYDAVVFILIEVWYFVLDLDTAALFAAVSRNEASALAEVDDVQLTVSSTAAAVSGA